MVDEPQGEIYGGVVAAPAFEKIVVVRAARTCGIPPGLTRRAASAAGAADRR